MGDSEDVHLVQEGEPTTTLSTPVRACIRRTQRATAFPVPTGPLRLPPVLRFRHDGSAEPTFQWSSQWSSQESQTTKHDGLYY
jgi:hypothetical protein